MTALQICVFSLTAALAMFVGLMGIAVYRRAIAQRDEFTAHVQASRRATRLATRDRPHAKRKRKAALIA